MNYGMPWAEAQPGQKKSPEWLRTLRGFRRVHASEGFPVAAEEVSQFGIVGLDDLARLVGDLIELTLQIGGVGDQGADHVGDFRLGSVVAPSHEVRGRTRNRAQ